MGVQQEHVDPPKCNMGEQINISIYIMEDLLDVNYV
jgi:hypothetical protein